MVHIGNMHHCTHVVAFAFEKIPRGLTFYCFNLEERYKVSVIVVFF